jgi:hypothetical protein
MGFIETRRAAQGNSFRRVELFVLLPAGAENFLDARFQKIKVARLKRVVSKSKTPMKFYLLILTGLASLSCGLLLTGCTNTEGGHTSPYHPGPVVGKTVGEGVGVVAGNVAGAGVGVVEGTVNGAAAPFNPSYHMVRYWRTETTSDGRTIQVPYDILVDQYGRPVKMPAPTGNPAPPPGVTAPSAAPAPTATAPIAPPPTAPMTTNGTPQ